MAGELLFTVPLLVAAGVTYSGPITVGDRRTIVYLASEPTTVPYLDSEPEFSDEGGD